jgi:hypothetical protein
MKITHFTHTGVLPDGRVPTGGAVEVNGRVLQSEATGGCGSKGCRCSPGHWISVVHPRTEDGVVFGYTARFDSRTELEAANLDDIEREARLLLN